MNSLKILQKLLQNHPEVKRYKNLESLVFSNPKYKQQYQDLLAKQKQLVQSKTYQKSDLKSREEAYKKSLENLISNVCVHEYLMAQEEINDLITMLFNLIETEINTALQYE